MIARLSTVAFQGISQGIEVPEIDVRAQMASGLLGFTPVGPPDKGVAESRAGRGGGYRLSPEEAIEVGKALFIDRAMMGKDCARACAVTAVRQTARR
jgi:hypothetical protein